MSRVVPYDQPMSGGPLPRSGDTGAPLPRFLTPFIGREQQGAALRTLLQRADELHALGLELSEPAEIALALRGVLPSLPTNLLSLDELEQALVARLATGNRQATLDEPLRH